MKRFSELIKSHLSTILTLNTFITLFCLPWAIWCVICQCFSAVLIGKEQSTLTALTLWGLGNLPCFILLAIGLSGVAKCCANMYYNDSGNVRKGFSEAKPNISRYCLLAIVLWLSLMLMTMSAVWLPQTTMPQILAYACLAISCIQFVLISGWTALCAVQNLFFEDKPKDVAINGLKLLFANPLVLVYVAIAVLPYVCALLLPLVWQLTLWVIILVVFSSPLLLFIIVKCNTIFEKITKI